MYILTNQPISLPDVSLTQKLLCSFNEKFDADNSSQNDSQQKNAEFGADKFDAK